MIMRGIPKIEMVLMEFSHHTQEYVLFTLESSSKEFLFFQNQTKSVRSIFFGEKFAERIPELIQDSTNDCIECALGIDILGGISIDGKDQVEFGISVEEANHIIDELKTHSTTLTAPILYFH